jgi:outer membrane protein TolC
VSGQATPTNPLDTGRGTVPGATAPYEIWGPNPTPPKVPDATPAPTTPPPAEQPGVWKPTLTPSKQPLRPSDASRPEHEVQLPETLNPKPGGLTARGAADRARKYSTSVRIAQAGVQMAEAQKSEVARQMVPTVMLSARYTRLSDFQPGTIQSFNAFDCLSNLAACQGNPNAFFDDVVIQPAILNQYAARATVSIPLSDIPLRLMKLYDAAGHSAEANRLDGIVAQENAALGGREAFYEYLRALGQVGVAKQAADATRTRLKDMEQSVKAGTASQADLLRVQALLADFDRLKLAADNGLEIAEAQLRQRLRMKPEETIVSGEHLDVDIALPDVKVEGLIQKAWATRPEIQSIQKHIQAIDSTHSGTKATQWPSLAAVGNADMANPNPRIFPQTETFKGTWDATLQLTWSPSQAYISDATLQKLRAQREQLLAQQQQAKDAYEMEVRTQWRSLQLAKAQVNSAAAALASAEENYRVKYASRAAGAATISDVAEAAADLLRARFTLVHVSIDVRIAFARLERAVGGKLR